MPCRIPLIILSVLPLCSHGWRFGMGHDFGAGECGIQHWSVGCYRTMWSLSSGFMDKNHLQYCTVLCLLQRDPAQQLELINLICDCWFICAGHTGQEARGLSGISQQWRTMCFLPRSCIHWSPLERDFFYMQSSHMAFACHVIWLPC